MVPREFPEIVPPGHVEEDGAGPAADAVATTGPDTAAKVLLEVGCGVGNTVFPLLDDYGGLFVYCCDFSPRAVGLVQANEDYDTARCKAFQNDLTSDDLTANVPAGTVDCVTMLFMLSAISPEKFAASVANVAKVLKQVNCMMPEATSPRTKSAAHPSGGLP